MLARDATGRRVSLLNDDAGYFPQRPQASRPMSYTSAYSAPSPSSRSNSASPHMPELLRSDSYDSQTSDPVSPMTPSVDYAFSRSNLYALGQEYEKSSHLKRPVYSDGSRATSYVDDDVSSTSTGAMERPGKRYPCRYRESHGCEKTFTTSGHASRHSKIHTAEKAVQCTYPSCQKKFTRADNMKQHLETHFKDKSRSSGGPRSHKASVAESRRAGSSSRSRSSRDAHAQWETDQYALPSPHSSGAWDMHGLSLPLLNRPVVSRAPSSGLDALAMAVACHEGGR